MTMEMFEDTIREMVEEQVGDKFHVRIRKVRKNNGVMKTALEAAEGEGQAGALLYIDDVFHENMDTEDVENAARSLSGSCKKHAAAASLNSAGDIFSEWTWADVKDRVIIRLINAEWNREMLEQVPYRCFLDLCVVYHLNLGAYEGPLMTTMVSSSMAERWGIQETDLFNAALNNMKEHYPATCRNISEVIGMPEEEGGPCPIRVLSNEACLYGAAALIYSNAVHETAEKTGADIYVLPSSVHEVLLLPATGEEKEDELTGMVRSVNRTQVMREEWLSDNVYCYDHRSKLYRVIR